MVIVYRSNTGFTQEYAAMLGRAAQMKVLPLAGAAGKVSEPVFYMGPLMAGHISGIDQALWDIKGKHFDAPVYQLMGGPCRDRMRVYSWIGGDRPSDVAQAAKERQAAGFTAIKMNGTEELQFVDSYEKIDEVLERVASIREAVGKYFGIAVDFHGRVHKPMAKILAKKLEEFDPMFLEEPVLCENMEDFK